MNGPFNCISNAFVFNGAKVPIASARFLLNFMVEPHQHEFNEIVFVLAGQGMHHTAEGQAALQRGDVFLFRPGAWHGFDACAQLQVYNCYFSDELLNQELAWIEAEPDMQGLLGCLHKSQGGFMLKTHMSDAGLKQSQLHLETLRQTSRQIATGEHARRVGNLILLLGQVAQTLPANKTSPNLPHQAGVHAAVAEGMRLMESRLEYDWSLSELSSYLHIDRSYLVRLFRTHAGLSPMAYLCHQRAHRAAQLLLDTDIPITDIAESVGWPDPNYFARRFKAEFGVSASAYRSGRNTKPLVVC